MSTPPPAGPADRPRLTGEIHSDRPLIVAAVAEEAARVDSRFPVLVTGMGKVNAAAALSLTLAAGGRPREIINLGTAGALREMPGGVHEIAYVIQHDLDRGLLQSISGYSYGHPLRVGPDAGPVLATGDTFVSDSAVRERLAREADLVDMEGYAVATVAERLGIPVRLVKFVSDQADESARTTWPEAVAHAAGVLAGWLDEHADRPAAVVPVIVDSPLRPLSGTWAS
ncbi:nucleosidase [Streptomyces sp. NPDC026672]|uniref:nucleosidase n=1 Tax=unclassified Streptomyces TaxID=2593676 RepID=UPI0033F7341C